MHHWSQIQFLLEWTKLLKLHHKFLLRNGHPQHPVDHPLECKQKDWISFWSIFIQFNNWWRRINCQGSLFKSIMELKIKRKNLDRDRWIRGVERRGDFLTRGKRKELGGESSDPVIIETADDNWVNLSIFFLVELLTVVIYQFQHYVPFHGDNFNPLGSVPNVCSWGTSSKRYWGNWPKGVATSCDVRKWFVLCCPGNHLNYVFYVFFFARLKGDHSKRCFPIYTLPSPQEPIVNICTLSPLLHLK